MKASSESGLCALSISRGFGSGIRGGIVQYLTTDAARTRSRANQRRNAGGKARQVEGRAALPCVVIEMVCDYLIIPRKSTGATAYRAYPRFETSRCASYSGIKPPSVWSGSIVTSCRRCLNPAASVDSEAVGRLRSRWLLSTSSLRLQSNVNSVSNQTQTDRMCPGIWRAVTLGNDPPRTPCNRTGATAAAAAHG